MILVGFQERRVTVDRPFRARYGLDSDFSLFGEYVGVLGNASGSVRLKKAAASYFTPHILVDEVRYDSVVPWPVLPRSGNDSIMRVSPVAYGNLADCWNSGTPTPGAFEADVTPELAVDPLAVDFLLAG